MNARQDTYHFALSLVIIVGGGYLLATHSELRGEVAAVLGTVVGWWFTKATNGVVNGHGAKKE
jgi:hypothetical protein